MNPERKALQRILEVAMERLAELQEDMPETDNPDRDFADRVKRIARRGLKEQHNG